MQTNTETGVINGFRMVTFIRKVVLHDIVNQVVYKCNLQPTSSAILVAILNLSKTFKELNWLYNKYVIQTPRVSAGFTQNMAFSAWLIYIYVINTLRPRQNGRHFADDIFKRIFLNENIWIPIKISLKFVPKGSINNIPALVQIMAWRRPGDKPLSEPMMLNLPTYICVTRAQWVNQAVDIHTRNTHDVINIVHQDIPTKS